MVKRRRAAWVDVTWMIEAVAQLDAIRPGVRELVAEHWVIEALEDQPGGAGPQFGELAAMTGLPLTG